MESESKTAEQTRRSMLTGALRGAALAALAVVGGFTVVKRRRLIADGKCINDEICHSCTILAECGLPAALAAKQSTQRGDNGSTK